jgi:hypothetical protein
MDNMEDAETAAGPSGPARVVERATLGKEEAEKVAAWLRQLEESSKGFLMLSRSEVVNFIVREHKPELSAREMQQIRSQHYDPIRHLNWITPRLKDALQKNDMAAVAALQDEIRGIELSVVSRAKEVSNVLAGGDVVPSPKPRRRKSKRDEGADPLVGASFKEMPDQISEG